MKSCLRFFCWLTPFLLGLAAQAQLASPNKVKYQVTFDPNTNVYSVWVIPEYNVPNLFNTGSTEKGGTAQVTLKVPSSFSVVNVQDVKGNWDKMPQRLGPGNSGQDWSGYNLDPAYNYFVIGKSATETDYGSFKNGVPVKLFTFQGNGCFGTLAPLPPGDPFINAADQQFSLSVQNSFNSKSGQPAGGNILVAEQFDTIAGPPADCRSVGANPDSGTLLAGTSTTVPILANDNQQGLPVSVTNVTVSISGPPTSGTAVTNPNGTATYTAAPGFTGPISFTYTVCDKQSLTVCATATVSLTVIPSIVPQPDSGTVSAGTGGTAVANVTLNDLVNGASAILGTGGNATAAAVGFYPNGITFNPTTGSVSVAIGTVPGSYTVAYQLCDKLTTPTCATTTVAVLVLPSVIANTDSGTASSGTGGVAVANVAANDIINGATAVLGTSATLAAIGTYQQGITLDPSTGSVSVAVGTVPGSYTVAYQICSIIGTPACATTTVAVLVLPSVIANTDSGTASSGTGGVAVANVAANDIINGATAVLGTSATLAAIGTYQQGITLDPSTGSVSVAVGTVPGSYTVAYQICSIIGTPACATTTVAVLVLPSVIANTDSGTASSGTGGVAVANVAANDIINGATAVLGTSATLAAIGTYQQGITLDPSTGSVSVAVGTVPGSYTVAYQICSIIGTPACATTTVAVLVLPSVIANTDSGTASSGTGGVAVANVAANDIINGATAVLGTSATLTAIGTYQQGITLDPSTGSVSVAVGTVPGSYTVAYQICSIIGTPACATTTVAVLVLPSVIANTDSGTASSGTGGVAVANVAANDIINGATAVLGTSATLAAIGTYQQGITLDPSTGSVSVAVGTVPGSYTVAYQICSIIGTPACATTTVAVLVLPSVIANTDSGTASSGTGGVAVANVAANDIINGATAVLGTSATLAAIGTYQQGITLDPSTGSVSVAVGTVPGSYTVAYQICSIIGTPACATTTVAVLVLPSVIANTDSGTASSGTGGVAVANVAANDIINGATAVLGTSATLAAIGTYQQGITLDPSTGSVSVAVGTVPGSYTVAYQICSIIGTPACATTTVAVLVLPSVIANTDSGTASSGTGGVAVANVAANDIINGATAVLGTSATLTAIGTYQQGITLDPSTGSVSVAVGTVPGSYTVAYQICSIIGTPACATTTVAVLVLPSVIANTDSGTASSGTGGVAVANVAANDIINGATAVLGTSATLAAIGTYQQGITLDPSTGSVSVAVGTVPGSYTVAYQICSIIGTPACATTTVAVLVLPSVIANTDSGTASSGTGGVAVANVAANDIINGATAVLGTSATLTAIGTYQQGITLDPSTGSVSVAVGTVPGSYTVAYQICSIIGTPACATTTVAVLVLPSVIANTDSGTASSGTGGVAVANVAANDIINGATAVLGTSATLAAIGTYQQGITLDPSTGSVSVAVGTVPGSYTVAYQICSIIGTPACATTTVAVLVLPSVIANTDSGTASSGTGGVAVANVAANDIINGATAVLGTSATLAAIGTYQQGITLDPSTGSVSVAVGTVPGSYTVAYQICSIIGTPACATTTVAVLVLPSVIANTDSGTASSGTGGVAVANVAANDIINGATAVLGTSATLAAIGTYQQGITLDPSTGSVSVAVGTVPGSYTVAYQICSIIGTPACATTTVAVLVLPSVIANTDSGTASSGTGGVAVANVAANDIINGATAVLGTSATLAAIGTYQQGITLDPSTGSVSVAVGTVPGSYTVAYQICSIIGTPACATTTVAVLVLPSVIANTDSGTASSGTGGVAVANVAANDIINGATAVLGTSATLAAIGTYQQGITLDPSTGSVSVAVGTVPGSYTVAYQICSIIGTPACATTTVAVLVLPSVIANTDSGTASSGTGGVAVANVAANDIINGATAVLGTSATLTAISTYQQGITLDPSTGSVSVAVGTVPGSYTVAYQICSIIGTPACATTTVAVLVLPSVIANTDSGTASSGTGGVAVANVAANDIINGATAVLGTSATLTAIGTYQQGITLDPSTGSVSVAVGTVPGSYTVAYQICSIIGTPACATTTVAVLVLPSVIANTDSGTASSGTGGVAVANVAANDIINGATAVLGTSATLAAIGTYQQGITLNPSTGSVSVAVGTVPGSYTVAYQICSIIGTPACATSTIAITVYSSINPAPDSGTAASGTGGIAVANVVANDIVNGLSALLGNGGNATIAAIGTYPPGITLDPSTGSVSVAVGTAPGSYTVAYQLCDLLSPITCATTTVTVVVTPAPPVVTDDFNTVNLNTTATGNVLTNDYDPQGLPLLATLTTNPATGTLVFAPDGSYAYTPPTDFTGLVTFTYTACNPAGLCQPATVSISVLPNPTVGNNAPVAHNDATRTRLGQPVRILVTANDTDPDSPTTANGQLTPPVLVSQPAQGTALVNGDGSITYSPPANFTGLVSFAYQVCDGGSPALCSVAQVTVNVLPPVLAGTTLAPVAVDDALLTRVGVPATGDVSLNDSDVNSPTLSLSYAAGTASSGTVVMGPDGRYSYTPAPGFSGPASFTYSVCNSAGVCDAATVSILVQVTDKATLLAKVYLQGALLGVYSPSVLMRDDLRAKGLLPTTSPYGGFGALTPTGSLSASVTAVTGSDAIVDWVYVELRDPVSPTLVVDSRSALLQRDGDVVDVDGVSSVRFDVALAGSYYVAVRHRNHLGVMSGLSVPVSVSGVVMDFRQASTSVYSYTASALNQAQVVVDQGAAMWAGNTLSDMLATAPHEVIHFQGTNNDVNLIYQRVIGAPGNTFITPFYKLKGYASTDVDLNGETLFQGSGNDVEMIYQNIIKNHPGNTLLAPFFVIKEQLP